LYENKFICRNINGRFKPVLWGDKVFESVQAFKNHTNLSTRPYGRAVKSEEFEGKVLKVISQYEYVVCK